MRYAGAKDSFAPIINTIINRSNKRVYIEPFCGSAGIFFNLEKEFDQYILCDLDRNVIRILESFQNGTYEKYQQCIEGVNILFGDIKKDKEAYYAFRNAFNKTHLNKNKITEGFYLHMLYNSCINSMARFGPNGFNQSYGNRFMILNEEEFNVIHTKLQKAKIICADFFDLVLNILPENPADCLFFLDPPYIKRPVGYKTISNDFYINYIEWCKTYNRADIVYTDINHDDLPEFDKYELRTMQNISPNRRSEYLDTEVILTNIKTTIN